ncbi:ABC transporter substrate-binding protein [Tessaracoccus sp. Y36]
MKLPKIVGLALASTLAASLTACAGGGDNPSTSPEASGSVAGTPAGGEQIELTVWGWEPTLEPVVEAFEKANPDIDVNLENVGGAGDTYTKLDNAIAAGSGAPDVAQIEYYAVGQYAIPGRLADLTSLGAADLKDRFTTGTWNAVTLADSGKIYGLPVDSGPMALFYNEAVFTKAGVTTPPETWEEYYEAAKKIRALGDNYYITSDNGDAGFATSMMWMTGAKPFGIEGDQVTINLGDEGVVQFAEFWQRMIDEDLINTTVSGWSDDWFKGLGDGTLASLITGAWMPANLVGSAPDASGDFRVAAAPVPEAGTPANAENGGSSMAILESSQNKEAAYRFLEFNSSGDGVAIRVAGGNFPSTKAELEDPEFLGHTDEYFGGQAYNEVLAQAAEDVLPGWSYLPFQVYANSIFGDKVTGAYTGSGTLTEAYAAWQTDLESYAKDNGFQK